MIEGEGAYKPQKPRRKMISTNKVLLLSETKDRSPAAKLIDLTLSAHDKGSSYTTGIEGK